MVVQFLPLMIVGVAFILMVLWNRTINRNTIGYQCSNCGEIFTIDPLTATIAPHSFGKKYVRCPHCGQMSWAVPVPKQ